MIRVYISLTSIPSRVSRLLESCVHGLMAQDYPNIQGIIVTVPRVNMRGQVFSEKETQALEAFSTNDAFKKKNVRVHRPEADAGPMMKFLGAYPCIAADVGSGETCVFVCDDDQVYPPNYISSYVSALEKLAPADRKRTVLGCIGGAGLLCKIHPSFMTVMGVKGILLPSDAILRLYHKIKPIVVPTCCAMNDDVFVSLMLHKLGYTFLSAPLCWMEFSNTEPDGLCKSYSGGFDKQKQQIQCHARFNTLIFSALVMCGCLICVGVALCLALAVTVAATPLLGPQRRPHTHTSK